MYDILKYQLSNDDDVDIVEVTVELQVKMVVQNEMQCDDYEIYVHDEVEHENHENVHLDKIEQMHQHVYDEMVEKVELDIVAVVLHVVL